jgi:hypothetical protein
MRYIYTVDLDKMDEVYFGHTQQRFFQSDEQREKFNAELVIEADSEEEALAMRIGMTDIRMWNLARTED